MSRGGIYKGPGGQSLHGDGREIDPVRSLSSAPEPLSQMESERALEIARLAIREKGVVTYWQSMELARVVLDLIERRSEIERLAREVVRAHNKYMKMATPDPGEATAEYCEAFLDRQNALDALARAVTEAVPKERS